MPNSKTSIRTTSQGQTWDQVSREELGHELHMGALFEGNVDHADAVLFSGNTPITVPPRPAPARTRTLPPWEKM